MFSKIDLGSTLWYWLKYPSKIDLVGISVRQSETIFHGGGFTSNAENHRFNQENGPYSVNEDNYGTPPSLRGTLW